MEEKIRVLLVEDQEDFRQLLGFWLTSKGYSVSTASNGQEAVDMVKKDAPDIVFLDLNMPVMDGPEALKQIRSFNKDIPVIIISAHVDDKRAKEAMDSGISGVFYKGSEFQDGLALLETTLRTHKKLKK